ncbi:MAG: HIRAN domain-containing protein [Methylobacter sp.]
MTDLLPISTLTQQLMQRTLQKTAIALPFAQDIFLLETHIAGLRYYEIKQLAEPLQVTASLILRREPGNSYDGLAIEVISISGLKLGYVPQHRNPVLARLMDAGKTLVAEVVSIQCGNDVMSACKQDDDNGTAIFDVRLKIFLHE